MMKKEKPWDLKSGSIRAVNHGEGKKFHVELSTFFRDKTMVGVSIAPLSAKFNLSFVSFTLSLIQ